MEDPISEIADLITDLATTLSLPHQRDIIECYFLPTASFNHPLCRVDTFYSPFPSRDLILAMYRWHRLLSPNVKIDIRSVAFDEPRGKLYVECVQTFTFWFLPWKRNCAEFVVQLHLQPRVGEDGVKRWFVARQNDLFQTEDWVAYLPLLFPFGRRMVNAAKLAGTGFFWVGMTVALWLYALVMWACEVVGWGKESVRGVVGGLDVGDGVNGMNGRKMAEKWW